MAQLFKFSVDDIEITAYCNSRNTRSGFAHDCDMFMNGHQLSSGHCFYLNRTWEKYCYQSVLFNACHNAIESRSEFLKRIYKEQNNLTRLAGKNAEAFRAVLADDSMLKMLAGLREKIDKYI